MISHAKCCGLPDGMIIANECDGSGPHRGNQTRVYPLGAGGNLILCSACWDQENRYRAERARETRNLEAWSQEDWDRATVYKSAE